MVADISAFASRLGLQTGLPLAPDSKQPVLEGGDEETVAATFSGVECIMGDAAQSLGPGTLYVTTRRVLWVGGDEPATSIGMQYGQIVMHAVSKNLEAHDKPCVYLQLDEGSEGPFAEEEDEEGEDALPAAEVRFVPDAAEAVEDIFKSLCECSALNPDTDNEDDGQAEFFFDEAEALAGLPADQRASVLAARAQDALQMAQEGEEGEDELLELMADDPDRFEDDEECEAGGNEERDASAPGNGYAH